MARRKKHMKLPNGFGSIKYLGPRRRRPYAVYPPVEEWTRSGPVSPPALAYTETWEEGYEILTARKMELEGKIKLKGPVYIDRTPTFAEVYDRYFQEKYFNSPKKYSQSSIRSTQAAFRNCSALHDLRFGQLRYEDLQEIVNRCPLKHSSLELIISLLHQMYAYAMKYEIVDKDYSVYLYMPKAEDDESGEPFSPRELKVLWEHKSDPVVSMILIMCYSGYRISAYSSLEVNLKEKYFRGGVKTAAGKNRIVPIHSGIYEMVVERWKGCDLLGCSPAAFRKSMTSCLESLGISQVNGKKHTPHDCRHTFSSLCELYGVSDNDRKRMLGHSFGGDITNQIYGHRTVEDLRKEIEKIKIPE